MFMMHIKQYLAQIKHSVLDTCVNIKYTHIFIYRYTSHTHIYLYIYLLGDMSFWEFMSFLT